MKIAIVHDFLAEYGGAERVVESLLRLYPQADFYVGFYDWKMLGETASRFFRQKKPHSTCLQSFPGISRWRSPLRVLAPGAFAQLDLTAYDVVIISSNAYHAKAIKKLKPGAKTILYCHTPARSLYGFDASSTWKQQPVTNFLGQTANHFLRLTDFETAQKMNQIIANSQVVQKRIQKYWRRESTVVYPPVMMVDRAAQLLGKEKLKRQNYFLYVNRLNYAKHPELAVAACMKLNLPLKIVGDGPMYDELKKMIEANHHTTATIELLGKVDDRELARLYAQARAVLYPVIDEDFGIVPVEAMAFGTPVIAHFSGGPTETIRPVTDGIFFEQLDEKGLIKAIKQFESLSFDHQKIKAHAQTYSEKNFQQKIAAIVSTVN